MITRKPSLRFASDEIRAIPISDLFLIRECGSDLPQLELPDLAAGSARKFSQDLDPFRPALLCHPGLDEIGLHCGQIDRAACARHDERAAALAEPGIRKANH